MEPLKHHLLITVDNSQPAATSLKKWPYQCIRSSALGSELWWVVPLCVYLAPSRSITEPRQVLPPQRGSHSAIRPVLIWFSSAGLMFREAVTDACGEHASHWAKDRLRNQHDTICTYRWQSAKSPPPHPHPSHLRQFGIMVRHPRAQTLPCYGFLLFDSKQSWFTAALFLIDGQESSHLQTWVDKSTNYNYYSISILYAMVTKTIVIKDWYQLTAIVLRYNAPEFTQRKPWQKEICFDIST